MLGQSGGKGTVSESVATITAHGGIEQLTMPEGFAPVKPSSMQEQHNYLECKVPNSTIRICYEQSSEALMDDDIFEMEKLFAEQLTANRKLNLYGDSEAGPDDSLVYGALCQCFVFGGSLVRDGSIMDMDSSVWEMRNIGGAAMLCARLKFIGSNGSPSKREALMVMAQPPGQGGCGYLWLEGTYAEVRAHEPAFLTAVANGKFSKL